MENQLPAKRRLSRIGLCYSALLLIMLGVQLAGVRLLARWADTEWFLWVLSIVPLYAVALPIFLLMAKKLVPDAPGARGTQTLSAGGWTRWLFLSLGVMYLLNLVSTLLTALLSQLKGSTVGNPLDAMLQASNPLVTLIFAGILGPIGEEFIFRKVLFDKLGCYGERMYILTSAFLFAMFHMNLSQLLYAFAMGAIFAYIYARTGKLRYTVALHITVNVIGSVLLPMVALSGGDLGVAAAGVFVIVIIIVGVILLARGRWKFPPAPRVDAAPAEPDAPAEPAPTFGRALLTPGMILFTLLCAALILVSIFFE